MEENLRWLNEEFLNTVLKASIESDPDGTNDFHIIDHEAEREQLHYFNYSTPRYRVSVSYKDNESRTKKKSFIVKKMITAFTNVDSNIGSYEVRMLKILMNIEECVNIILGPRFYTITNGMIVMNDMSEQGFEKARVKLLDYDHYVLAVKNLAKFHAGSIPLRLTSEHSILGTEILVDNPIFDSLFFYENQLRNFGQEISTWPESRQYADHFPFIARKLRGYLKNMHSRNSLGVLCHGGVSLYNMMFRYNNDQVCEQRIVSLHSCRLQTLTSDFQHLIGSSTDLDVRRNRLDDLVNVYLDTFNSTLADLGIAQSVTRQQFEEDLKEDYYMYFLGMTTALYIILGDFEKHGETTDVVAIDQLIPGETSDNMSKLLNSKVLREFIPQVLDDLNEKGVFQSFRS